MFTKVAIFFVILCQYIEGSPLETTQPQYDVKKFLAPRIVGGQDAPKGYAKHMMALVFGYHVKSLACGASIVTKRHAVTAAHCILSFVSWDGELSPHLKGVIGSNYWKSTNFTKFSGYKTHPEWNWATLKNDIGVLVTEKPMVFNEYVGPVKMSFDYVHGGIGSVTAWGQTAVDQGVSDKLQLLRLLIISHKKCKTAMRFIEIITGTEVNLDPEVEMCTVHLKGFGMCFGDSGSPLILEKIRKLVGIVSWGWPCGGWFPDVFVRVSGQKDFLMSALGKYLED